MSGGLNLVMVPRRLRGIRRVSSWRAVPSFWKSTVDAQSRELCARCRLDTDISSATKILAIRTRTTFKMWVRALSGTIPSMHLEWRPRSSFQKYSYHLPPCPAGGVSSATNRNPGARPVFRNRLLHHRRWRVFRRAKYL